MIKKNKYTGNKGCYEAKTKFRKRRNDKRNNKLLALNKNDIVPRSGMK